MWRPSSTPLKRTIQSFERRRYFISQKAYTESLDSEPAAADTSPEAEKSRKILAEALRTLQNLEQLVNGTTTTQSS